MESGNQPNLYEQVFLPEIRRARLDKLTIFDVTASELDILERGSPDSVFLNVSIALLSAAVSLTATVLTTVIEPITKYVIFIVCIVVGYVSGAVLLLLWRRSRNSVLDCIKTIRERLPPEGTAEQLDIEPDETPSA
jgi:hypothetical protein